MSTAITESEVEEMQFPTDKVKAICAYAEIPFTRDPAVIAGAVEKLRMAVNARDIQIERIKQDVKRQALGILGIVGLTFDDLHAWKIKREEKR